MRVLCLFAVMAFLAPAASGAELDDSIKDIVGVWRLDFTSPDDVHRTPVVVVGKQNDELVGWYVGKDNRQPFESIRLKDETLLLTIIPKKERGDVTVTFAAKLKKDGQCHGQAKYTNDSGDSGTWDFTGKRLSPSDFGEVAQWSLSFVTPDDQQREATITVLKNGEKLYGWYSSKEYEIPATEIHKVGDSVILRISTKTPEGAKVDVTFRGAVAGDSVKGNAEYELEGNTGSFAFTGTRKP